MSRRKPHRNELNDRNSSLIALAIAAAFFGGAIVASWLVGDDGTDCPSCSGRILQLEQWRDSEIERARHDLPRLKGRKNQLIHTTNE